MALTHNAYLDSGTYPRLIVDNMIIRGRFLFVKFSITRLSHFYPYEEKAFKKSAKITF